MFIAITNATNGQTLLVNTDHIVYLEPGGHGTNVYLTNRERLTAVEPPEEIERRAEDVVYSLPEFAVEVEEVTPPADAAEPAAEEPADEPKPRSKRSSG